MKITKAVITAAGRGIHLFPAVDTVQKAMLPLNDRDGLTKPLIQIIIEEAIIAGIEEICIVCAPGDKAKYLEQFQALKQNLLEAFKSTEWAIQESSKIAHLITCLRFVEQNEPLGYGHAVYSAREFVNDDPFLLLLGDHLYISRHPDLSCAQQLIKTATSEKASVSSVNPVREHLIRHYGTLTGERLTTESGLYKIKKIIEKPSISTAEVELPTPGLRAGYYLCFFGMHVFMPSVFEILDDNFKNDTMPDRYGLTPALNSLASNEPYLALELKGTRYDVSAKYGMLRAQIALGLAGKSRDQILGSITDMLAEDSVHRPIAD